MSVVVIGLNHRIAPLEILERTSVDGASLPKALDDLCARQNITEAVLLSTCNRTEVYVVAERFHGAYSDVRDFIAHHAGLRPDELTYHLYSHFDDGAAGHLFAVAAGLDSAVLGESEILGQVRDAWEVAKGHGTARSTLNALFRQALEVGKRVRTETGPLPSHRVGVDGGGRDGRRPPRRPHGTPSARARCGRHRRGHGGRACATRASARSSSRTARSTVPMVSQRVSAAVPVRLLELADALTEVDVLLTSTGARSILVEHADLAPVMEARPDRPLLVVDVAVPRDVDPGVAVDPGRDPARHRRPPHVRGQGCGGAPARGARRPDDRR